MNENVCANNCRYDDCFIPSPGSSVANLHVEPKLNVVLRILHVSTSRQPRRPPSAQQLARPAASAPSEVVVQILVPVPVPVPGRALVLVLEAAAANPMPCLCCRLEGCTDLVLLHSVSLEDSHYCFRGTQEERFIRLKTRQAS
jgi:hypothetical protein